MADGGDVAGFAGGFIGLGIRWINASQEFKGAGQVGFGRTVFTAAQAEASAKLAKSRLFDMASLVDNGEGGVEIAESRGEFSDLLAESGAFGQGRNRPWPNGEGGVKIDTGLAERLPGVVKEFAGAVFGVFGVAFLLRGGGAAGGHSVIAGLVVKSPQGGAAFAPSRFAGEGRVAGRVAGIALKILGK